MSKKKKTNKSIVGRRMNKGASPSPRDGSEHPPTSTSSTGLNLSINKINKIGRIWKKQPALLAVSSFFILALAIYGAIAYQNTIKDESAPDLGTANRATDNTPAASSSVSIGNIEIRDVVVTNIMDRSLTVTWKTNVPSTSELSAEEQKTNTSIASWPDNNLVLEHKIVVEGLQPSTTYTLRIKSKDVSGKQTVVEIDKPYQTLGTRFATATAIGQQSPNFILKTVNEESVRLSDFQGKWVMIVFWMTSCNGCREELPYLNKFWINSKFNNFILLTINVAGQEAVTKNYVKSQNLTLPVLLDPEKEVSEKYTVAKFPTIFLIDPGGTVNKIKEDSFKNEAEIDAFVRSATQSN
jgi:peroxiredoxin